jgi:hypothetical protein
MAHGSSGIARSGAGHALLVRGSAGRRSCWLTLARRRHGGPGDPSKTP